VKKSKETAETTTQNLSANGRKISIIAAIFLRLSVAADSATRFSADSAFLLLVAAQQQSWKERISKELESQAKFLTKMINPQKAPEIRRFFLKW
jgi:hypothetical protein